MKFLLSYIIVFFWASTEVDAQNPFNKLYDFNGTYLQMPGEVIHDFDDRYIIAGYCVTEKDTTQHFHISSIDRKGQALNSKIWENENGEIFQQTMMSLNETIEYENHLYLAVESKLYPEQCILKIDKELSQINEWACYRDSSSVLLNPRSIIQYPEGYLSVVMDNELPYVDLKIAKINLKNPSDYEIIKLPQEEENLYISIKILKIPDSENALIVGLNAWKKDIFGAQTVEDKFKLFLMTIDSQYNVVDYKEYFNNVLLNVDDSDALYINETGELIMSVLFFDRNHYDETLDWIYKPSIVKFDTELNLEWIKPFNTPDWTQTPESFTSIVRSHEKNGFIITGFHMWGGRHYGMIGKVDNNGDSLWYYKVESLYDKNRNILNDVIASKDGYYTATGYRSIPTFDDSLSSYRQMWVIKFDEEGQIVNTDDIVSNTDIKNQEEVSIYPNPSKQICYINHNSRETCIYSFFSANGELLEKRSVEAGSKILTMDTSKYDDGMYLLQVHSQNGTLIANRKIIISN